MPLSSGSSPRVLTPSSAQQAHTSAEEIRPVWRPPWPWSPGCWHRHPQPLLGFLMATGWGVLLYGYVDLGGVGPIPGLGDPSVRREDISAVAEAIAALGALCLLLLPPP
jgi:hypothetical protein